MSDSRITFKTPEGKKLYCDIGQKLFIMNPSVVVGFSGDVSAASKVIKNVYIEFQKVSQFPDLYALKDKLIGTTKEVYQNQFKNECEKPKIQIIYGILQPNKLRALNKKEFFEFLKRKGSGYISGNIINALQKSDPNKSCFDTGFPVCILVAISFPKEIVKYRETIGGMAIGSGQFIEEFITRQNDLDFLMYWDMNNGINSLSSTLKSIIQEKIIESGEKTVGGLYQVVLVTASGADLYGYSTDIYNPDGTIAGYSMQPTHDGWIQKDTTTGKIIRVVTPEKVLSLKQIQNYEFNFQAYDWKECEQE